MMFDTQSMFSDKQAITASAVSTNVIDLGVPGTPKHAAAPITQDVGRGRQIPIRVQVTEDFNNLTSLEVVFETSNDEAFGTVKRIGAQTRLLAELTQGEVFNPSYLPRDLTERYVRLSYVVVGTAPTAGAITAGLVFGNEDWSA